MERDSVAPPASALPARPIFSNALFSKVKKNAQNAQSLELHCGNMNCTVRFVHPGRSRGTSFVCPGCRCGTFAAASASRSGLRDLRSLAHAIQSSSWRPKPPVHCSGGFIPPVRFSSADAIRASRKELQRPRRHRGTERYSSSLASLRPLR